jgi:plasmid stabilization system protein ParE
VQWIGDRSQMGAVAWNRAWQTALRDVKERAERFGLAPESGDHPEQIRQTIFKTRRGRSYRALFLIRDQNVYVLHVRAPGQDYIADDDLRLPEQNG